MTDVLTFGETMLRLSPPGQERLELAAELEFRAAGAESNVAVNVQRLGLEGVWMSKLPDSPLGRKVTAHLRRHGITTDVVWSDEGRQGTYYLEHASEPRQPNVIYDRQGSAVTTATPAELPTDRFADTRVFYTSGITPALSDTLEATVADLLPAAREQGARTVFDLNYRSKLWDPGTAADTFRDLFPEVDVLVAAARDAATVLDRDGPPERVAADLAAEWDFETVLVTLGEEGALAWHDGQTTRQPAFEADTYDPIGTGDAFTAGYLVRRLEGDDVATALEYGAATAALKRTMPGDVATVTPGEVEAVIEASDVGEDISR
ncbi:MAG: bifunctional 2-dehydro-3-deoxygluconokinase/2-dehydro-3-deoxygalactonokinase [Halobacteriaceae archaeon]